MARSILLAGIALLGLGAATAARAEATDAEAGIIKAEVEDWVGRMLERTPGVVATTGPATVTAAGDRYEVTLPPAAFPGRNTTVDGIRALVTPTPEGWFTVRPTATSPLFSPTADGPSMTLTFEKQSGSLTWAPAYQTDMATDLVIEGLALTTPDPAWAKLARLSLTTTSRALATDRYDQKTVVAAEGLTGEAPDAEWTVERAEMVMDGRNVDFPAYAAVSKASAALTGGERTEAGSLPPDLMPRLWAVMFDYPPMFDAGSGSFGVANAQLIGPAATIAAGSATMAAALDGLTSGAGSFDLTLGWTDLSVVPPPPQGDLLPSDLSVDIALAGIPNADVVAAVKRLRETSGAMDLGSAFAVVAGELAPVLLLTPGLSLEIDVTGTAAVWTLDLDASFRPEPASPFRVAGGGDITIGGIDDLIALYGTRSAQVSTLQALTMFKMLGTEGTDARGRPTRTYELVMSPEGRVTLNGTDLAPLLQGL